jgi:hypothetical protein
MNCMKAILAILLLAAVAACARPPVAAPVREPELARARAALAALSVDNRTGERLLVAYRLAARPDSEVVAGQVPPQSFTEIAPVPAGESLILLARTAAGHELTLEPRAFPIDGEWTWVIPADTRFVPPPAAGPEG